MRAYNAAFDAGLPAEPAFGKSLALSKKFDTPPYYAIQLFPLARKNFGGVKTDLRCRVLNRHFEPVPGLYAAGEVAGMAGGHINGTAGLEGRCSARRSSAAASPAALRRTRPASGPASSAGRTDPPDQPTPSLSQTLSE